MANATNTDVLERNIHMADAFLARLRTLPPDARARIPTTALGSSRHTGALMATADELTTLRNRDRDGRLGQFIVDVEQRMAEMGLPQDVDSLAKAAVRAILTQHLPGRESATKTLYEPFEGVVPYQTLG
ncbi:MAG TPA: hypothetical protein VKA84_04625 [Gemmatimonadaceae bacterium]|nr:hypothetical protein [Gemmatimonadaceae bacterium]